MRYSSSCLVVVFLLSVLISAISASAQGFATCIGDISNCDPSASSISFGPATVGGGAFAPVKFTNTGSAPLTINYSFSAPAFAFGLAQTLPPNPLTIQPGASVQTFIVFLPTAAGFQTGQFLSNDNAPGSPHMVPLSGTGVTVASTDFALMLDPAGPSSFTLKRGATTSFPVYVLEGTGQNLSAGGAAQCSGGPAGSTCTVQPSVFPAFSSQEKLIVSVQIPAKSASLRGAPTLWASLSMLPAIVLLRRRSRTMPLVTVLFVCAWLISCGGSGSSSSPPITVAVGVNGANKTLSVPVSVQ